MASERDYTEKGALWGGGIPVYTANRICDLENVIDGECQIGWDRPQKRTLRGQPPDSNDIRRFDIFSTSDAEPLLPPDSLGFRIDQIGARR